MTNVFVKVADWNQNGNQGQSEIRASHGGEYKRLNQSLLARVGRIDSLLAEYNEKQPNQTTVDVVSGFLADKPLARRDQGKDFVEFTAALLEYYKTCTEPCGKEFLEMFFFAFQACGLRMVDVMTLQRKHIDFTGKELRKIMIKTNDM